MTKWVKDRRVGTVLPVSDDVAKMMLKDPDIVEVSEQQKSQPAKARAKAES